MGGHAKIVTKSILLIITISSLLLISVGAYSADDTTIIAGGKMNDILCESDNFENAEISITPSVVSPYDISFYEQLEYAIEEKELEYQLSVMRRDVIPYCVNLSLTWVRQENLYYCEPATAVMILDDFTVAPEQDVMAEYLGTTSTYGTPWYSGDGSSATLTLKYFNMPYGLNRWQHINLGNIEFPYSICYGESDKSVYIQKILSTLADGYAVPLQGSSGGITLESVYLQFHTDGHWLAIEGYNYTSNGLYFYVVDSASGLNGYYSDLPEEYRVSSNDVKNFIDYGVVW